MIVFPGLLAQPAKDAGIPVPDDVDNYDPEEYPYFNVFWSAQIGQPMPNPSALWENAKVIARVPKDRIRHITLDGLVKMGFQIGIREE